MRLFSFTVKQVNSPTFVSINQLHSSTVIHYTNQINSYKILSIIKYPMKQSHISTHN